MAGGTLRRGFKTGAERTAARIREELELEMHAPLSARILADHLGIMLFCPTEVPGLPDSMRQRLLVLDEGAWSAATVPHPNGDFVIYNTAHSKRRQESDLMHEFSHILCKHPPGPVVTLRGFPFPLRTYDEILEEEAQCMGATLQLPRDALLWALQNGLDNEAIADHFTASLDMVRFRRNTTGVDKQLSARRVYAVSKTSEAASR